MSTLSRFVLAVSLVSIHPAFGAEIFDQSTLIELGNDCRFGFVTAVLPGPADFSQYSTLRVIARFGSTNDAYLEDGDGDGMINTGQDPATIPYLSVNATWNIVVELLDPEYPGYPGAISGLHIIDQNFQHSNRLEADGTDPATWRRESFKRSRAQNSMGLTSDDGNILRSKGIYVRAKCSLLVQAQSNVHNDWIGHNVEIPSNGRLHVRVILE